MRDLPHGWRGPRPYPRLDLTGVSLPELVLVGTEGRAAMLKTAREHGYPHRTVTPALTRFSRVYVIQLGGNPDAGTVVLATVVSKPVDGRIILDAGAKALAADGARGFAPLTGHATVLRDVNRPGAPDGDLIVERLSEEHATVRAASGRTPLEPGDRVRLVPNHSCVVSNLVDRAWITEAGAVLGEMPIAARGLIT